MNVNLTPEQVDAVRPNFQRFLKTIRALAAEVRRIEAEGSEQEQQPE